MAKTSMESKRYVIRRRAILILMPTVLQIPVVMRAVGLLIFPAMGRHWLSGPGKMMTMARIQDRPEFMDGTSRVKSGCSRALI